MPFFAITRHAVVAAVMACHAAAAAMLYGFDATILLTLPCHLRAAAAMPATLLMMPKIWLMPACYADAIDYFDAPA